MLTLLSPSKTLNEDACSVEKATKPVLLDSSKVLIKRLKSMSKKDISKLMGISDKLSELNFDRFQSFSTPFTPKNAKPALTYFKGDVYEGLKAEDFDKKDFEFAQKHLRILSGLYGLLRPMDLMQAYRLEMGTKLKNEKGKDLYEFWGEKITEKINEDESDVIVNLASNEYFKAVKPKKMKGNLIVPVFKEKKGDDYKVIGLFAKKARGMMARYIIKNRINNPEKIKDFNESGYKFNKKLSNEKEWVFTRNKM